VLKIQIQTHNIYVFCLVLFTFDLLISKCTFNIVTIYLQWSITGTEPRLINCHVLAFIYTLGPDGIILWN